MDDAHLVEAFQRSGDETHFRELVERHRAPVFRLVLSILGAGRCGAAEELTQDVFVRVYRRLGQFRGDAKFSSWLYRIAYNEAIDHRNRLRFKTPHFGEDVLETQSSTKAEDDPFGSTSQALMSSALEECMAQLPDLYRSVLHQYYWMGMTVPEISEALSAPKGTVKSYLFRARAKLHKLLAKKGISDV